MNIEMRDVLARVCRTFVRRSRVEELEDWRNFQPLARELLQVIDAAGYVVVERDRWDKLERLVYAEDAMWQHEHVCDGEEPEACQPFGRELVAARAAIDWIERPKGRVQ